MALLQAADIKVLADIRRFPGSRLWPQFNRQALERALRETGVRYIHFPGLGGKRPPVPGTTPSAQRFGSYAAYMNTPEFRQAIQELEQTAGKETTVYMCAEALWSQCHRSLVSNYMKSCGWQVLHIVDTNTIVPHPDPLPPAPSQGSLFL